MRTRRLLAVYISKAEGVNGSEGRDAVVEQDIWCYGIVCIPVGDGWQVVGGCSARRHRRKMLRSVWYIAAEFCTNYDEHCQVYYGKVLIFLRYTFRVNGSAPTKDLILAEWAMWYICKRIRLGIGFGPVRHEPYRPPTHTCTTHVPRVYYQPRRLTVPTTVVLYSTVRTVRSYDILIVH